MEYFLKKRFVKLEFKKIKTGYFSIDNPKDINKARFIAEIKDVYYQSAIRGASIGASLTMMTLFRYPFWESILIRGIIIYMAKEITLFYYMEDFYRPLEIINQV
jgi:hypothetical protein